MHLIHAASAVRYLDLGLMHRVSLSNAFDASPELATRNPIDFPAFVARWGPYIDGVATPFGLRNTSVTAVQLPVPFCSQFVNATAACTKPQILYWSMVAGLFNQRGWLPLLYDYTVDEPLANNNWDELLARGSAVHAADPRLRVLCTIDIPDAAGHPNETGVIDLWVPIINFMESKDATCKTPAGNTRWMYDAANISQSNLWWYQSCMSHGCDGGCSTSPYAPCEMGWPSYMIDHPAVVNRVSHTKDNRHAGCVRAAVSSVPPLPPARTTALPADTTATSAHYHDSLVLSALPICLLYTSPSPRD